MRKILYFTLSSLIWANELSDCVNENYLSHFFGENLAAPLGNLGQGIESLVLDVNSRFAETNSKLDRILELLGEPDGSTQATSTTRPATTVPSTTESSTTTQNYSTASSTTTTQAPTTTTTQSPTTIETSTQATTTTKYTTTQAPTTTTKVQTSEGSSITAPAELPSFAGELAQVAELSEAAKNLIVNFHNQIRSEAALGLAYPNRYAKNMNKLVWDNNLAASSKIYASYCNYDHSINEGFNLLNDYFGENIAYVSGTNYGDFNNDTIALGFLDMLQKGWSDEQEFYDLSTKECQTGKVCGHYTQIVWARTTKIGCGLAKCDYFRKLPMSQANNELWDHANLVCQYQVLGNTNGDFPFNFSLKREELGKDCTFGVDSETGLCSDPVPYRPAEVPNDGFSYNFLSGNKIKFNFPNGGSPTPLCLYRRNKNDITGSYLTNLAICDNYQDRYRKIFTLHTWPQDKNPNGDIGKIRHVQGTNHDCVLRINRNSFGRFNFDCVYGEENRHLGTNFYYSRKTGRLTTREYMKENFCVIANLQRMALDMGPCDVDPIYLFGTRTKNNW